MDQDRAPAVLPHHDDLAGPPAGQPGRHRLYHRRLQHPRGPGRPRRTRPPPPPPTGSRSARSRCAALQLDRHDWHGDWIHILRAEPPAPAPKQRPFAREPERPDKARSGPDLPGRQRHEPAAEHARDPLPDHQLLTPGSASPGEAPTHPSPQIQNATTPVPRPTPQQAAGHRAATSPSALPGTSSPDSTASSPAPSPRPRARSAPPAPPGRRRHRAPPDPGLDA